MNIVIRPVKKEDAIDINTIRRMEGVFENILALPSERIERNQANLETYDENNIMLVAEIETEFGKKVVGVVGIQINKTMRLRHSGSLGIMVHKDYQGSGIGKMLMEKILDIADNWLMLVRVELGVYVDNDKAIALYEKMGFEKEGIRKYCAIKNGKYVDDILMARYRNI